MVKQDLTLNVSKIGNTFFSVLEGSFCLSNFKQLENETEHHPSLHTEGLHYKYTPSLLNSRESLLVHLCCLHSCSMQAQVGPGHGRAAAHKVSASSLMQYRSTSSFTSHCSTKYPTAVLYITLSVLCFTQEECSEAKITLHLRVQECF